MVKFSEGSSFCTNCRISAWGTGSAATRNASAAWADKLKAEANAANNAVRTKPETGVLVIVIALK